MGFKRFNENLPVPFVQFVMQLSTAIEPIFPLVLAMTRIAIFASGAGTNAENIINYFRNHETIAVALIVCNKPGAGVLTIAARENIPTLLIEKEQFFRGNGYVTELQQHHINFLVLAGFLWKVPQSLISAFPNAIINIHPALLPNYGGKGMFGMKVHETVVTAGDKESGITIHYVDEHYDNGDIIFQEKCPVSPGDTPEALAAKIHQLEYQHFPRVIEQVISLKKTSLMTGKKTYPKLLLPLLLLTIIGISETQAQVKVSGRVYDVSKYRPLEAVSVLTSRGYGTASDSLGHYSIIVSENDSIWFSYLNKPTPKFAVKAIGNKENFDVSLHVTASDLKEVKITPPNYRFDSLQNRLDNAKIFNFQKPGIGSSLDMTTGGVGLDLDEFINMFKFRRNKRMMAFQKQLLQEEEDKYIDHRFSRALVIKLTQLHGEQLDTFMKVYRPTVEFVATATDYEFQDYIKKCFSHYQRYRAMMNQLKGG